MAWRQGRGGCPRHALLPHARLSACRAAFLLHLQRHPLPCRRAASPTRPTTFLPSSSLPAVPTMHQILLSRSAQDYPSAAPPPLRAIRSCSSALAPATLEQLEKAFKAPVLEVRCLSEPCFSGSISWVHCPPPWSSRKRLSWRGCSRCAAGGTSWLRTHAPAALCRPPGLRFLREEGQTRPTPASKAYPVAPSCAARRLFAVGLRHDRGLPPDDLQPSAQARPPQARHRGARAGLCQGALPRSACCPAFAARSACRRRSVECNAVLHPSVVLLVTCVCAATPRPAGRHSGRAVPAGAERRGGGDLHPGPQRHRRLP